MTDARFWIKLIDTGPNTSGVVYCLHRHAMIAMSDAIRIAKNPPQNVHIESGLMTYEEARRKAEPIVKELTDLGATADWDFDYGDVE